MKKDPRHPIHDEIVFLRRMFERAVEMAHDIKYTGTMASDRYLVTNYGSMIELTKTAIHLISEGLWIGIDGVARSIFELHINLLNVLKDPKYLRHLEAANHQAWVRRLSAARNGNPYLHLIGALPDLPKQLDDRISRLNELKQQNFGPLLWKQKFSMVGFSDEYESAYSFMSEKVHNDVAALLSRHMDLAESPTAITWFRDEGPEDHVVAIDATTGFVTNSTKLIHERFKTSHSPEIEKLLSDLGVVREHLGGYAGASP